MRFLLFTHSLVSDWNHGNAHFQRGILRELSARGHEALALEPAEGWSRHNLLAECGPKAIQDFEHRFPELQVQTYGACPDLDRLLEGADVVLVHEWTDPTLIETLGRRRLEGGRFLLLFHDTHHRGVSAQQDMAALKLDGYDAVLAFGEVLGELYRQFGWGRRAFCWHEAADLRLFKPLPAVPRKQDLVWIGNWGDGERDAELREYLLEPARDLGLSGVVHGVRYPEEARESVRIAGLDYRGWLPNADVPAVYAGHRMTLHVPRRPYVEQLPGIPTIRVFEALACGIPLLCAPWRDEECLFRPGQDFLLAEDGQEMKNQMAQLLAEPEMAKEIAAAGLETIRSRHSCAHRVDELFTILRKLELEPSLGSREAAAG
ncbi:CgeB family protein [Aquibaculum arenosum]|uniref:Glycosyltransferase n=1 Tax=Aquibaculum arenosum TaxID=3032591 RepID=A0ABT5YKF1_9PROT|nr:glycosyltransferase [Fodinicurvata sp. CAU 1616]MDF2095352.1 glycosyltransferase [Fodinicurvata sp. CAU 1616]